MKNLFFACLVCFLGISSSVNAMVHEGLVCPAEIEAAFARVLPVASALINGAGPHVYDSQMPTLTQDVHHIFTHFSPGAELMSHAAASNFLKGFARENDSNFHKPRHAASWPNLLDKRLPGDLHPQLLPMALYCAQIGRAHV